MQPQRSPKINFREIFWLFDFRLLQQYRHIADISRCLLFGCFRDKADISQRLPNKTQFMSTRPKLAHSITSSARASNAGDTVSPIAFAVLRLMTSSNLVGCSTGNWPGFD